MKYLEVIVLRLTSLTVKKKVMSYLMNIGKTHSPLGMEAIRFYRNARVETDLCIHIHWDSQSEKPHKSVLGIQIYDFLRDIGPVNHSIWISEEDDEKELSEGCAESRSNL